MTYFYFADGIHFDKVQPLINFINTTPGDLTIYINSGGGDTAVAEVLLDIFTENKDRITLVASVIYSAAFWIFYAYIGKKRLNDGCTGMWHMEAKDVSMRLDWKPNYTEGDHWKRELKDRLKGELKFANAILTKKEFKRYKRGLDVYFTYKRMKEIFK